MNMTGVLCTVYGAHVYLWVYYTIPFGFSLFWHFWVNIFYFWNPFVWWKITDEVSLPEVRILSILLIKSRLKMVYSSE